MRILLAAPDRDLLDCYRSILQADFGETVTAFDGTQVLSLISAEEFDLIILDRSLPRITFKQLLMRIHRKGIPVIALTDEPVSSHLLMDQPGPNAWLPFPFTPQSLNRVIRDTLEKAASGERWSIGGLTVDVPGFRFEDGPGLSAGELDVLRTLLHREAVSADEGACISALNAKLAGLNCDQKIRYRSGKGFELVNEDE